MADNLPNVSSSRGAPMGRTSTHRQPTQRVYLRRVRLDSGGYDSGGAYWGIGQRLYHACEYSRDGLDVFFRAADRAAAKAKLRADYPEIRFYK